jgi:serine/threonine protein phosphatase 1
MAERVEHWFLKAPPRQRGASAGYCALLTRENAPPETGGGETGKSVEPCAPVALSPVHYGIGDIHGMRAELDRLLPMIEADAGAAGRSADVVFLGDLINRGPASRQVLERLIEGPRRQGDRWIVLRGNHDQLFLDAIAGKSEAAFEQLIRKGGLETLASYGLRRKDASLARARRAVPGEHLRFLDSLPLHHVAGDYLFVHAGVEPGLPLEKQSEKTMMNIREPFLRKAHRLPYTVVHGHVANAGGPVVATGRICVDTGAHATGVLTAVALRDREPARFLATAPD